MSGKRGQKASKPTTVDFEADRRLHRKIKRLRIDDFDGRFKEPKFVRQIYAQVCADRGGEQFLSEIERLAVEDYAFLELRIKRMQDDALRGNEIDWGSFGHLVNVKMGLAKFIGKDRRTKPTMTLQEYIASKDDDR